MLDIHAFGKVEQRVVSEFTQLLNSIVGAMMKCPTQTRLITRDKCQERGR